MKLVTRAQLGWPASAAPSQATTKGVKVHYEGTAVSTKLSADHDACIAEWKAIRKSHLANKVEGYSDVAYNYAACPHGYLLEGRGIGKRTGANGNQPLNVAHYAIVGLVGSSGLTQPNDAMLGAIRDGIDLLRKHGAGTEIKGHCDGYATACPGVPLYAWVKKGAPRPSGTTTPPPSEPQTEETPMAYTQITEGEADGPELVADTWTTLRMAKDTAIGQGPCSYNVTAYISVKGTPGTRIDGRFYDLPLATGTPSSDRPMHGGTIGPKGTLDAHFSRPGTLDTNEQLKFEICADQPGVEITYRFFRFLGN